MIADFNNSEHLDLEEDDKENKKDPIHGIHPAYKSAINKLFYENPRIQPMEILKTLLKRDNEFDVNITKPNLTQIQNYKRTLNRNNNTNEIGPVEEYLDERKFVKGKIVEDTDAFEFGSNVKSGSNTNHLFIFLTSLVLINFIKMLPKLPAHIDCT